MAYEGPASEDIQERFFIRLWKGLQRQMVGILDLWKKKSLRKKSQIIQEKTIPWGFVPIFSQEIQKTLWII